MPLLEINRNILGKTKDGSQYRFFQDSDQNITLHMWQFEEGTKNKFGIVRFQIDHNGHLLEWAKGKLKYGNLDSGDKSFGIKESPIMMMNSEVNEEERFALVSYLKGEIKKELPELGFITKQLQKKQKKG